MNDMNEIIRAWHPQVSSLESNDCGRGDYAHQSCPTVNRTVERRKAGLRGFELLSSDERNGEIGEIRRATQSVSAGPFIEHRASRKKGGSRGGSGGVDRS